MGSRTFFLSLNNWGLNFLQNECSQSSQIYLSPEKLRQMFTFSFEWWNWPKYRIAKCQIVVFSITVSIIVQKLKFCKIEIEYTHITLLSAWDRSRDSTAKRTLSKHMWRSTDSSSQTAYLSAHLEYLITPLYTLLVYKLVFQKNSPYLWCPDVPFHST